MQASNVDDLSSTREASKGEGLFRIGPEAETFQHLADAAAYRYLVASTELHAIPREAPQAARDDKISEMRIAVLDFLDVAGRASEPVLIDQEFANDLRRELLQNFSGGTLGALLEAPQRTEAHRPKESFLRRRIKLQALVYLHGAEMGIVKTSSPIKDVREACGLRSEGTVRAWREDSALVAEARELAILTIIEHAGQKQAALEAAFAQLLEHAGIVYRKHVLDSGLAGARARKKAGT